jgi:hypothetical protein
MSSGFGGHRSLSDFRCITKELDTEKQQTAKNKMIENLFILKLF